MTTNPPLMPVYQLQSDSLKNLAAALNAAQKELRGAVKDSKNPFFNSKYADLESVWEACREPLARNGLAVSQTTIPGPDSETMLVTTLMHNSGEWIRGFYPIKQVKNDPQAAGSAMTYARRYTLAAAVGIIQVDDDAESAMPRSGAPRIAPEQPQPGDGHDDSNGNYRIPFGKYAKRSLEEVGPSDLRSYVDYIEKKAEKDKKPLTGQVADFVKRATDYIVAFEQMEPGAEG